MVVVKESEGGGGKEGVGGVPLMRSLTVSYCTFLLLCCVFVSHFLRGK